jgi:hypothetical protein
LLNKNENVIIPKIKKKNGTKQGLKKLGAACVRVAIWERI